METLKPERFVYLYPLLGLDGILINFTQESPLILLAIQTLMDSLNIGIRIVLMTIIMRLFT